MPEANSYIRTTKKRTKPFEQIDRAQIQCDYLSWKATGLYCYLCSLPEGWKIYQSELCKHKTDGESSTRAALRELKEHGHIVTKSIRDDQERVTHWETVFYEYREDNPEWKPHVDSPHVDFPHVDFPHVENPHVHDTHSTKKTKTKDLHIQDHEVIQAKVADCRDSIEPHVLSKAKTPEPLKEAPSPEGEKLVNALINEIGRMIPVSPSIYSRAQRHIDDLPKGKTLRDIVQETANQSTLEAIRRNARWDYILGTIRKPGVIGSMVARWKHESDAQRAKEGSDYAIAGEIAGIARQGPDPYRQKRKDARMAAKKARKRYATEANI